MGEQQEIQIVNDAGFVQIPLRTGRFGSSSIMRAVSIATEQKFEDVRDELVRMARHKRNGWRGKATIRDASTYREYLERLGWVWTPTMGIGTGCKIHLYPDQLPTGRLVVKISKRIVAVINGVVHDTVDPSRAGKRCVYGYWRKP